MSKAKSKTEKRGVLVYEMTPKLATALKQLLDSKKRAIKSVHNYVLWSASLDEFMQSADEVCFVLERMVVNGQNH